MSDIATRIRKIVAEKLGVEEERIALDAAFIGDLDANSLDKVEIVMALEEEFDIEISDDDAESVQIFGDAVTLISRTL
jgi:acyl carrier protein